MTPNSMPLDALLDHVSNSDQDSLKEILEHTLQALIEAEAAAVIGAGRHERTPERQAQRNGDRPRTLDRWRPGSAVKEERRRLQR